MSASIIWLPETAKDALCLDTSEVENIDDLLLCNQSIVDWLNGKLDTGTLTDILMQFEVDPKILDDFENYVYRLLRQ